MSSTLPEHMRPRVGDMTVPVDEQGRWIDNGHWREHAGITHWHLIHNPREWSVSDPERFDTERMRVERIRSSAEVARTPHEVVEWLTTMQTQLITQYDLTDDLLRQQALQTAEERRSMEETQFRMAMFGTDICSGIGIKGARTVFYSAYAMTAKECPNHP